MTEQGITYTPAEHKAMQDRYIEQQRAKLADQLVRGADHLIISDLAESDNDMERRWQEEDEAKRRASTEGAGI